MDGRVTNHVYFPKTVFYKSDDPYVGELKFVTDRSRRAINVYSEDFDGWVYPDGSQYNVSDFPEAAATFGYSGTKFRVPELTDFFCGGTTKSEHVNATDVIGKHRHRTRITFKPKTVTGKITVMGTSNVTGDGGGHNARGTNDSYSCELEMEIASISFNGNCEIDNCESSGDTTHPTYNYMPVMIYIKRRKKAATSRGCH